VTLALSIFLVTYLVIGIQRLPKLHLGRPAGALLGASAMVVCGVVTFDEAKQAIDLDTILFLLGMMIVLGYLELSGFFEVLERRILQLAGSARSLLLLVIVSSGLLSALFMNDTICLMLAPVILRVTKRLELDAAPYLIALAISSNVGSACSLVGNPQNALIGVRSGIGLIPFARGLWPVSVVGLALTAGLLTFLYRRQVTGRSADGTGRARASSAATMDARSRPPLRCGHVRRPGRGRHSGGRGDGCRRRGDSRGSDAAAGCAAPGGLEPPPSSSADSSSSCAASPMPESPTWSCAASQGRWMARPRWQRHVWRPA
jgi:hypothetical protein